MKTNLYQLDFECLKEIESDNEKEANKEVLHIKKASECLSAALQLSLSCDIGKAIKDTDMNIRLYSFSFRYIFATDGDSGVHTHLPIALEYFCNLYGLKKIKCELNLANKSLKP